MAVRSSDKLKVVPVDTTVAEMVGTVTDGMAYASSLADSFLTTKAYAVGEYVTYGGVAYKCTTAHSAGAWNADHFTPAVVFGADATLVIDDVTGDLKVVDAGGNVVWTSADARKYSLVTTSTSTPGADSVQLLTVTANASDGSATTTITIPSVAAGRVCDFVVDAYSASGGSVTISNIDSVTLFTNDGVSLFTDVLTFAEGEVARITFTAMAYRPDSKATFHVTKTKLAKVVVE